MSSFNPRSPVVSPINCTLGVAIPEPVSAQAYEITAYEVYTNMRAHPLHNAVLNSVGFEHRLPMVRRIRDRYNDKGVDTHLGTLVSVQAS